MKRARRVALVVSVLPVALTSVAQASTLTQVVYPLAQPSVQIELNDLLRQDDLGYTCIEETQIDVAFFASGKGARLPQTCLPEPCTAALTQAGLGGLIGRPPTVEEWDDYYARYSDTCRAETTAFGDDPGLANPQSTPEFWTPILVGATPIFDQLLANAIPTSNTNRSNGSGTNRSSTRSNPSAFFGGGGSSSGGSGGGIGTPSEVMLVSSDSSTSDSGGGGTSDRSNGGGSGGSSTTNTGGGNGSNNGGGNGGGGGNGSGFFDDDNGDGNTNDSSWTDDGDLPPVPLPMGMWMALSGVAALGGLKLKKSRHTA